MKILTNNKKAYFNFSIITEYQCGIKLLGSEIKPIINNKTSITEAYCYIDNNEVFIKGMYVGEYSGVNKYDAHNPTRVKKLLLHKKEIIRIKKELNENGMTLIPLNIHTDNNGLIKLKLGLCKGKNVRDKRESIKDRDIKIETQRELNK